MNSAIDRTAEAPDAHATSTLHTTHSSNHGCQPREEDRDGVPVHDDMRREQRRRHPRTGVSRGCGVTHGVNGMCVCVCGVRVWCGCTRRDRSSRETNNFSALLRYLRATNQNNHQRSCAEHASIAWHVLRWLYRWVRSHVSLPCLPPHNLARRCTPNFTHTTRSSPSKLWSLAFT